jgi:PAS domain S-box-containing protein
MQDKDKTNKQLIKELKQLRRRIAELEALETERKRSEVLLQQEKEIFFTILQNAPYGVALVGEDGQHIYVNPTFTAITGYTLEDIPTGRDWTYKAYPDKKYRQKVTALWEKDKRLGGTKRVINVVCKDGETREIEFSPAVLNDGRAVAMLVDITERKQMEETLLRAYDDLKESETRYRTLVDNIDLGINLIDANHTIVMPNAAVSKIFNKPTSEIIGKKCFREFEKRDAVCSHCPGVRAMAIGKPAEVEIEGVEHDGSPYTARIQAFPISGHDGHITGFIEIMENITERKRAEEALQRAYNELKASKERERERATQLEASNQELEAFSYSVSHDLRAPLRGIDGFSQALLEDYADQLDTQGKDYLQRVRAASQRLEHIIDDMLILSRVTRREMRREEVNLSTMAQEIAAELQVSQSERQVSFVIASGVVVKADPNLMRIALENLLDNAWKFTSKHATARIEMGVTANEGEHAYYVRDDGAGFDMAYADKLFGAFQRLHPIKEFGGTGIGLATVWAEGAVEQGATFHFTLPR